MNRALQAYALAIKPAHFSNDPVIKGLYQSTNRVLTCSKTPQIGVSNLLEVSESFPDGILPSIVKRLCGTTLARGFLFYQTAATMMKYMSTLPEDDSNRTKLSRNTVNSYFAMARKAEQLLPINFVLDLTEIFFPVHLGRIADHVQEQGLTQSTTWSEYVLPKERRDLIKQLFDPEFAKGVEQVDPHARGLGLVTGKGDQVFSVGLLNHIVGLYNGDEG